MIFGESTDTLLAETPDAHSNELLKTFDAALEGLGKRLLLGKLRVLFFWDRSYDQLASRVHKAVDYYVDKAIDRQKKKLELEKKPSDGPKRYIVLDELLSKVHDRSDIRNHLLNIFLPGRDATAVGLSGVCFLLARHQHVWHKLRAEVLSIKGPLTYDGLKSLKYMRFVLNESWSSSLLIVSLPSANHQLRFPSANPLKQQHPALPQRLCAPNRRWSERQAANLCTSRNHCERESKRHAARQRHLGRRCR